MCHLRSLMAVVSRDCAKSLEMGLMTRLMGRVT